MLHENDVNDSICAADGKLLTRAFLRSASSRIEKKFAIWDDALRKKARV